jgi:hypothetical protein
MKRVMLFLVGLWILAGGLAACQRGDFANGNCSTIVDTAWVVASGPLNYTAPETLLRTCNQPTQPTRRENRSPS